MMDPHETGVPANAEKPEDNNLPNRQPEEQPLTTKPEEDATEQTITAALPKETAPAEIRVITEAPAQEERVPEQTNIPEEEGVTEEAEKAEQPVLEASPEENTGEKQTGENKKEEPKFEEKYSKKEIIERLQELLDKSVEEVREEIDWLKQNYYRLRKAEIEKQRAAFEKEVEEGQTFAPEEDELEEALKKLLNAYKEKRAQFVQLQERIKEENLERKTAILNEIKALTEDSDNINKHYNRFQELQQAFKEVTNIPQASVNDLWKTYQLYVERFYDMLKINKELRDYDFKKNLDLKTTICEAAEKLNEEEDILTAFRSLQQLHDEWRTIGPVAKELREDLWNRFKAASTVINKRHQQHFEGIKEKEKENEVQKTALCEALEAIRTDELKSFSAWDEKTKEVIDLQNKWKGIGFASRKANNQLFERFRKGCDEFFRQKAEHFKTIKEEMSRNLEKKKALCEKAESLKDSTDWKSTTDVLIAIQKEWKTIGPVPKKQSDAVWKRFIAACDYFFEQKGKQTSSQRKEEEENLARKKEIIAALNALDENTEDNEAVRQVREYMSRWNQTGHVPFKEKDKLYKEYQEALDKNFTRLNMNENRNRLQSFSSSVRQMSGEGSQNRLYREREKLMRMYEQTKNELQTYENNMGFLTFSSKSGEGLLKEMERKMQKLREEMELISRKIDVIDESLTNES